MPTRTICIVFSCPALKRLEADRRRPNPWDGEQTTDDKKARGPARPPSVLSPPSSDHIWEQSQKPCPLDRLGELSLLLGRHRCDPARHNLAALGDVALQ